MSAALHMAEKRAELRFLLTGRRLAKRRRMPRQRQPDAVRLAYFGEIRGLLQHAHRLVNDRLVKRLPVIIGRHPDADRLDVAPGKEVSGIVDGINGDFSHSIRDTQLSGLADRYFEETSRFQKDQLAGQLRAGIGLDIPVRDGPRVLSLNEHFAAENDAYIKSIPRRYFEQVEQKVLQGISAGKRWEDISDELQDRYDVSESSAKLIARDQVGKLYGALNQVRQQDLGIDGYRWRGVLDQRERDEHLALEGQYFDWDEPDEEEGHPGQAVNCRCYAEPDIAGLLASL